jgi:hypothetical protein
VEQLGVQFLKGKNMQIKYGIFNPTNGSYTYKNTYEEACAELASVGYEFYKLHCNNNPCAYIEVLDDQSEVWKNSEGVVVPSPEQIRSEMENRAREFARRYEDLPRVTL